MFWIIQSNLSCGRTNIGYQNFTKKLTIKNFNNEDDIIYIIFYRNRL